MLYKEAVGTAAIVLMLGNLGAELVEELLVSTLALPVQLCATVVQNTHDAWKFA